MLKQAVKGIAVLLLLGAAAGCSFGDIGYDDITGYSEAAKAKTLYTQLDSGHIRVVDNSTGEVTEEFTFMYRSDGNLMYSYMGSDGEKVRWEFHNGSEINSRENGETEWEFIEPSSEDYYVYTRTDRHPYTAEGVIAVNAYAITDSKVEEADGGVKATFYYDASLLAASLSDMGSLDSFESTIWLNAEGYCYRLDQLAVFDGGENVSDFSMFIDMMNEVRSLTRPETE
ncbi:MAG: hypothetical protein J1F60_08905 [Oscillospiraceae bacterium]|nr:hypothetical protein [Oscillospiraceae bacterium]